MNILILGNGFDLAHGLKTKYSDFLNYCAQKLYYPLSYTSSDPYKTNLWIRHFLRTDNFKGSNWIDLETEIYSVIKYINGLFSLSGQNCRKIFTLNYRDDFFTFYHFEEYINEIIVPINAGEKEYYRNNEHNQIEYSVSFSSKKGIINYLYDQLRDFTKLFEEYLKKEVLTPMKKQSEYLLSLGSIGVKKDDKDLYVLNFNYTDTCKRLYNSKFNTYCSLNIQPIYVHGNISDDENCNFVFGTQTFELNPSKLPMPSYFNLFQKHYQRHKYNTVEPYQELVRKIKKSSTTANFHIVGHSLEHSDHKILKHILLANDESVINIYFHDEQTQKRLMDNINSIIGEEEVMAKVRFIHQHDDERSILKYKK